MKGLRSSCKLQYIMRRCDPTNIWWPESFQEMLENAGGCCDRRCLLYVLKTVPKQDSILEFLAYVFSSLLLTKRLIHSASSNLS
mmetsp:Transcript_24057/g.29549  ORF Transcript_24057/g.29549 Transcript_24057/m.29549 type:complete len:84 (-) Transcript_24057:89-340(-)